MTNNPKTKTLTVITLLIFTILTMTIEKTYASTIVEEIKYVLPKDAIPAIKNPKFVKADEAYLDPDEPVIGLTINGESHAYSVYLLNSHEIVNDIVGGKPVAVTW